MILDRFKRIFTRDKAKLSSHSNIFNIQLNNSSLHRTVNDLVKYEKMYIKDGIIFSTINTITRAVTSVQWDLSGEDPEAVAKVEDFINNIDFDSLLFDIVRYALIYGDVFIEKVHNMSDQFVDLNIVDPKTIEILCNDEGKETGYIQKVYNESIYFEPDEMYHFKIFSIPSTPYGISMIGANYDTILRKIKVDESVVSAILHHGFPKYHIKVGSIDNDIIASEEDIEKIAYNFQDMNHKTEFVTNDYVNIDTLDTKGIEQIEDYTDYFMSQLIAGFGVPEEALGLGKGSTEASGKVRQRLFERMIKSIQTKVESFMSIVFMDISENKVSLVFRDISPTDEAEAIKWVSPLLNTSEGTFGILTKEEIRRVFNLPEISDDDEEEIEKAETKNDKYEQIAKEGYIAEELYADDFDKFKQRFEKFREEVKKEIEDYVEEVNNDTERD